MIIKSQPSASQKVASSCSIHLSAGSGQPRGFSSLLQGKTRRQEVWVQSCPTPHAACLCEPECVLGRQTPWVAFMPWAVTNMKVGLLADGMESCESRKPSLEMSFQLSVPLTPPLPPSHFLYGMETGVKKSQLLGWPRSRPTT